MTGIAVGLIDIASISVGSTPIAKVSVGDVQVWPAAAAALDLQFVVGANAINSGGQITVPASAQTGDLLILLDYVANSTTPTNVVPSGFTQVATSAVGSYRATASFAIATPSDPGRVLTGMTGSLRGEKIVLVFRGTAPISSVATFSGGIQIGSPTPAPQTVDPATATGISGGNAISLGWAAVETSNTLLLWDGNIPAGDAYASSTRSTSAWLFTDAADPSSVASESSTGAGRALFSRLFVCQP